MSMHLSVLKEIHTRLSVKSMCFCLRRSFFVSFYSSVLTCVTLQELCIVINYCIRNKQLMMMVISLLKESIV